MDKLNSKLTLSIILFLVAGTGLYFYFMNSNKETKMPLKPSVILLKNKEIKLRLADTALKQAKGLMDEKSLPLDEGMFFVFDKSYKPSFWMANTFIDLDIVWMDENLKIVYIQKNAKACPEPLKTRCEIYTPDKEAKYALEVNSGVIQETGVDLGDTVILK